MKGIDQAPMRFDGTGTVQKMAWNSDDVNQKPRDTRAQHCMEVKARSIPGDAGGPQSLSSLCKR